MANMNGDEVLLNCTVALGDSAEDDIIWTRDGKAIDLNDTSSESCALLNNYYILFKEFPV